MEHPFASFQFCPRCGSAHFQVHDFKSKRCADCGFTYYYNAAAATVAFIVNERNELLVCRRAQDPARGTMDLPGGFVDAGETLEESVIREVREETGLTVVSASYQFSLSDDYWYSGLLVRSCDGFFLCRVKDASCLVSADDAEDCRFVPFDELDPADFGLISVRRGVERFLRTTALRLRAESSRVHPEAPVDDAEAAPHDNAMELLPWVDADGREIGLLTRGECHGGSRLLHPVVHLHVFNSRGDLYLQHRPAWKDIQPDKWDTAVGGHIDPCETPEEALAREVREELGIEDFRPEFLLSYVFESAREREKVYVFRTVFDGEICPSAELDGGRFWSVEEIASAMGQGVFTPNFESEYRTYIHPLPDKRK